MSKIRVTKEFHFEMAHALWNYDGKCKYVHGHSYKLSVTVLGSPIDNWENSKNGMVMDFGDLKRIVKEQIVDIQDHALLLSHKVPDKDSLKNQQMYEKCIFTDYQPTCENMLVDFAHRLQTNLPPHVKLYSLRLQETATSYAEWFASDND